MGSSQLEAPPPLPKVSRSAARRREWTLWIGRSSDGALLPLVSSGMYSSVTAWRTSLGASAACVPWGAGAATTAPESPASLLLEVKPATSRLLRTAWIGRRRGLAVGFCGVFGWHSSAGLSAEAAGTGPGLGDASGAFDKVKPRTAEPNSCRETVSAVAKPTGDAPEAFFTGEDKGDVPPSSVIFSYLVQLAARGVEAVRSAGTSSTTDRFRASVLPLAPITGREFSSAGGVSWKASL
mmetsp:Transcript_92438/g.232487  ORF Transcript_92438/g.232487 Transcript_92438/m.232487 type:complete len:238 (+) Transcript_92438:326-1039(+)